MGALPARAEVALALDVAGTALAAFERRTAPIRELASHASDLVATAHAMATRFARGGKLVIFGVGGASTDAQHVAVEFVHPVDRKSTRLNSSHVEISYAVFCL